MKKNLITAAAFAFALSAGAAFAQSTDGTTASGEGGVQPPLPGLESFHTDASMMNLRTPDEMRASYDALSAGERQQLRDRCEMSMAENETTGGAAIDGQTTASTDDSVPTTMAELCAQVMAY